MNCRSDGWWMTDTWRRENNSYVSDVAVWQSRWTLINRWQRKNERLRGWSWKRQHWRHYLNTVHTGNTVDFVESRQSHGPVHTGDRVDRIGNKVERIGNNVETSWISMNTVGSKLKPQTQHERLCRRRFLAAATALIVETDTKITSLSAILSKWRH